MKQVAALAQMTALCLLLTACAAGAPDADTAQEMRVYYLEQAAITLTAEVTADYGETIFPCTLRYDCDGDGGTVSVLAPDTIQGLTVEVREGGTALAYDGAVWDADTLSDTGLSPATALPLALAQWRSGFIAEAASETLDGQDVLAVTTSAGGGLTLKTWFESETYRPLRGEFSLDGQLALWLDFTTG